MHYRVSQSRLAARFAASRRLILRRTDFPNDSINVGQIAPNGGLTTTVRLNKKTRPTLAEARPCVLAKNAWMRAADRELG